MSPWLCLITAMKTRTLIAGLTALCACAEASTSSDEAAPFAAAGVTSFQDGVSPTKSYAGTRDTMIDGGSAKTNNGDETAISADGDDLKEILLSWDITAIPPSAVVDAVTITLEVSDKSSDTFSFYEAVQAWNEATATWKQYDKNASWQTAGGTGASDRGGALLGSFSADPTGSYTIALDANGVALVQRWIATPASNHGLFLVGPSTTNRLEIRSREYGTASKRPELNVTWHDGGTGSGGGDVSLDPTPGTYKQACDGSFSVMIDATHFLSGNDETQSVRLYTRGASANALKAIDISSGLGLSSSDEADLEDAARVGNRIYAIGSHGRNKDGELERSRYRFFAMDVTGAPPSIALGVAGYTTTLLDRMLAAANWVTPDPSVIATISAAAELSVATDANLAPKVNGTNIEGLAWAPTAARPQQLLLGLRNPLQGTRAIVVSLLDADAVIAGAAPSFGEASLLDLGGMGIRAMTWSPIHNAVLVIAGPKDEGPPFALYKWSGVPGDAPALVQAITNVPSDSSPESIVVYDNTHDVQIVFDQGEHSISGTACKDASTSSQWFSDAIVHVPSGAAMAP